MTKVPIKPNVTIEDIDKLDVRVATIESVDEIAKSRKLMKLTLNLGDHTRTIVAGIKNEREDPKEIEGLQCLVIVNLEPRELAGVLSEGMIFDIGYADGIVPVLSVPEKTVPDGTRVG
ncbi:MAG: hypothetical protein ACR2PZ_27335 [Pseudomonadales bacterium]